MSVDNEIKSNLKKELGQIEMAKKTKTPKAEISKLVKKDIAFK